MATAARWIVGIAGLLFALSGFIPFTPPVHVWTAIVFGTAIGTFGFLAAAERSWAGALVALMGIAIVVSSFLGLLQTGPGHMWWNLVIGLVTVGVILFVREPELKRV
ncbi:MAG TPA: hypothetical protein VIK60_01145 [Vicinamibacterales bacterium]